MPEVGFLRLLIFWLFNVLSFDYEPIFRKVINVPITDSGSWAVPHLLLALCEAIHDISPISGTICNVVFAELITTFPLGEATRAIPLTPDELKYCLSELTPSITSVDLSQLGADDDTLATLASSRVAPTLLDLKLYNCPISQLSDSIWPAFSSLSSVDVRRCTAVALTTIQAFGGLPSLTSFKAGGFGRVSAEDLTRTVLSPNLFLSLQAIKLDITAFALTEDEMRTLLIARPNPAQYSMLILGCATGNSKLSKEFCSDMHSHFPNLTHLLQAPSTILENLSNVSQVLKINLRGQTLNQVLIDKIFAAMPRLETIKCYSGFDPAARFPFSEHVRSLVLQNVGDAEMNRWPNPRPALLQADCEAFFKHLISSFPCLDSLVLTEGTWTKDQVSDALRLLPRLKELILSGTEINKVPISISHPQLRSIPRRSAIANCACPEYGAFPRAQLLQLDTKFPTDFYSWREILSSAAKNHHLFPSLGCLSFELSFVRFREEGLDALIPEWLKEIASLSEKALGSTITGLRLEAPRRFSPSLPFDLPKFKLLTTLRLRWVISEENCIAIFRSLPWLGMLCLCGSEAFKLSSLDSFQHQRLRDFELDNFEVLSGTIDIRPEQLPSLRHLQLQHVSCSGTVTIRSHPYLDTLSLHHFPAVLELLEIADCPRLNTIQVSTVKLRRGRVGNCPLLFNFDTHCVPMRDRVQEDEITPDTPFDNPWEFWGDTQTFPVHLSRWDVITSTT